MTGERPALAAYLGEQQKALADVGDEIRSKELELASAIAAMEIATQLGCRNNAASRVVGRISLFIENLLPPTELNKLLTAERRLKARVEDLQERLGADDSENRLASTLSNIALHMSGYIQDLGGEFGQYPARLDLHHLTVVIDRPGRPIYMNRTGGGENHLAYHLAALLSVHRFAASYDHPVPRFMLIDQPTQVYFPSEAAYAAVGAQREAPLAPSSDRALSGTLARARSRHNCGSFDSARHRSFREERHPPCLSDRQWHQMLGCDLHLCKRHRETVC